MTTSAPEVSVVIPVHDGARFLAAALESVFAQTFRDFEVVVVDDGSRDDSAAVARRFAGVQVLSQAQQGVAAARNAGIGVGRGPMVALLDADDRWTPDKLERQLAFLAARPELGFCLAHMRNVLEPGLARPGWIGAEHLDRPLVGSTPSNLMVRREVLAKVGDFDTRYAIGEDIDWFCRAKDVGVAFAILPEVLLLRRVHDTNLSAQRLENTMPLAQLLKASLDRRRRGA